MTSELHTSKEWAELLDARIMDPDGWRRSNPYGPCDFEKDLITQADFDRRYALSTVDMRGYPTFELYKNFRSDAGG